MEKVEAGQLANNPVSRRGYLLSLSSTSGKSGVYNTADKDVES